MTNQISTSAIQHTHDSYIEAIAALALSRIPNKLHFRLTYGAGNGGTRGVTYYAAWKNGQPEPLPFVEVCASAEESAVQLAGTTIHELGHVLAGHGHGHDTTWKSACAKLGLRTAKAAGMSYTLAALAPEFRPIVAATVFTDGKPSFGGGNGASPPNSQPNQPRPCSHGIGSRGGKSRGVGSGSRLRKYTCDCGIIIRASRDNLAAHCDLCSSAFKRVEPISGISPGNGGVSPL